MSTSRDDLWTRRETAKPRRGKMHWILLLLILLLSAAGIWCWWVAAQIRYFANTDQAQPSDAIVVFGAAEYAGKPSPVYRARLDHARSLYAHGIAPGCASEPYSFARTERKS